MDVRQAEDAWRYAALARHPLRVTSCRLAAFDFADTPDAGIAALDARIGTNRRDFEARFQRAQVLMAGQVWNEELARKTFIAILEIIEPPRVKVANGQIPPVDPVAATYRRRLSRVEPSWAPAASPSIQCRSGCSRRHSTPEARCP